MSSPTPTPRSSRVQARLPLWLLVVLLVLLLLVLAELVVLVVLVVLVLIVLERKPGTR